MVALHARPQFEAYLRGREQLAEARIAREAAEQQEAQLRLQLRRMEELGADVFRAQQHIREEILTMKCPRCSANRLGAESQLGLALSPPFQKHCDL